MKRKISFIIIALLMFVAFATYASDNDEKDRSDALIVYFSATGNTEAVSETLSEIIDADIGEIVPKDPYTADDLDYRDRSSRTSRENSDPSSRPAIKPLEHNPEDYEMLFVGFPIWFGDMPKVLYTFFENYDLSGKTIIPFCTSGSTGCASATESIRQLENDAQVLDGTRISIRTAESDLKNLLSGTYTGGKR